KGRQRRILIWKECLRIGFIQMVLRTQRQKGGMEKGKVGTYIKSKGKLNIKFFIVEIGEQKLCSSLLFSPMFSLDIEESLEKKLQRERYRQLDLMVVHLCAHMLALKKNQTQVQGSDSYLLFLSTLCIVALFIIVRLIGQFITYHILASAFSFYSGMTSLLLTASNRHLEEKLWSLFSCSKAQEQASKSQTVVTVDV
uniref:Uncharacterized protein n=1 Tax=Sinocyclocheilus rhinocerous TaxID=307959 RepID=A0A673GF80_9TELE